MTPPVRFTGPLAAAWPTATHLADLLVSPDAALRVPPASDRATWSPGTGSVDQATLADLAERAARDLTEPWPHPTATGYARFVRDGDRDGYEQAVFARQRRLSRAAVLAAATLEDQWLDEVTDGLVLLCEQSSWCWPAHDDTYRVHGSALPTVTDPFLDLGAGEVVGQIAWIDHLLGAELDTRTPGLRARLRHEARVRVIEPFVRRRDWHWLGLDGDVHNWNPWIHGNVLLAALRLVEDAKERAALVNLVIEGVDRYVASLPADGAIDEGYLYWWNGACRALELLDVLEHATDGRLDATAVPALRATVSFPHRMQLGDGWFLNLADGSARPPADQPWQALHRAALRVSDRDAQSFAASHRRPGHPVATEREGLGRLLAAMTDQAWLAARPEPAPLPRDVWLASTQVLLARERAGDAAGLTLAVKGGHNGEHHNHNDVGSVVVAVGGEPVVIDVGRPTYTAQTFGPDRYAIWSMQSTWHNVPQVCGTAQPAGAQYAAGDVTATVTDAGTGLALDLADAYPGTGLRHWWRRALLERAAQRVTITDTWELDGPAPCASSLTFVLAGEVSLSDGHAVVTTRETGRSLTLTWDPVHARATLEHRRLGDPELRSVWGARLSRLSIDVGDAPTGTLRVAMEVTR